MTQVPQAPAPGAAAWFYQTAGRQFGPADQTGLAEALRQGVLDPEAMVWREGMATWLSALSAPEFQAAAGRGRRLIRTARQNSIVMFVIFCLLMLWSVVGTLVVVLARGRGAPSAGCIGVASILGAIYAAVYLPLRWRVMKALPQPFKALGLIGGFGLIAMLVLVGALAAVARFIAPS